MSTVTNATEQLQKARLEWIDFHDTFKDELKWTPEQISLLRAAFISFRMKGAGRLSDWPSQAPTDSSKEKENATCLAAPSRKQESVPDSDWPKWLQTMPDEQLQAALADMRHWFSVGGWKGRGASEYDVGCLLKIIAQREVFEADLLKQRDELSASRKQEDSTNLVANSSKLVGDAAARVEPTKWLNDDSYIYVREPHRLVGVGKCIGRAFDEQDAKAIVAAHNASCAPTKEEKESL